MKHKKRSIEWGLFTAFTMVLIAWMLVGIPALNHITTEYGTIYAYAAYLVLWAILGVFIGDTFHKNGIESGIVALNLMWTTDVIAPPIVIDLTKAPTQEILNIWGSDTFTYTLWSNLHLSHQCTWILTYILTPMIGFLLILYLLSGRTLTKTLKTNFPG